MSQISSTDSEAESVEADYIECKICQDKFHTKKELDNHIDEFHKVFVDGFVSKYISSSWVDSREVHRKKRKECAFDSTKESDSMSYFRMASKLSNL